MSIPENDYHFNTIDCTTKNSQIYKLGDIPNSINNGLISSKTHNMTIDFATSIEGLKIKVIKGPNEKEEDENYFGIISLSAHSLNNTFRGSYYFKRMQKG